VRHRRNPKFSQPGVSSKGQAKQILISNSQNRSLELDSAGKNRYYLDMTTKQQNGSISARSRAYRDYSRAIQTHRRILSNRFKVREIGIFGSVVKRSQTRASDIDILVDFEVIPDLLKFIELELYLEKILKRKVDLVDKEGLHPELREDILRSVVYV